MQKNIFLNRASKYKYESLLRNQYGKNYCAQSSLDGLATESFLNHHIKRFVVLAMTPRSGSTLLSSALSKMPGIKGKGEWLRWKSKSWLKKRAGEIAPHNPLDLIVDKWNLEQLSATDLLAVKCDFRQLAPLLLVPSLRRNLRNAKWIYLSRNDTLGQAISRYRAQETNYHHSDRPPPGINTNIDGAPEVSFDWKEINRHLRVLCEMQGDWEYLFACLNIQPLRITYESLVSNFETTVMDIAKHLELPAETAPSIHSIGLNKIGDTLNDALAKQFQGKCASAI